VRGSRCQSDRRRAVDTTKAQLTERPFSAPPPPAPFRRSGLPGKARTTSVSREFLPERSVGPEAWARPTTAANRPRRPRRPDAAQAPSAAAGLGVCAGAPGGAPRALPALRGRDGRGVLVQGAGVLPLVRGPPHECPGGPARGACHPSRARAAVGAVAALVASCRSGNPRTSSLSLSP
jgi:hypothetical protein